LVEEGLPIDREFYFGHRAGSHFGPTVFMASSAGGMDIEQVAADTPELIMKETIDPAVGFRPFKRASSPSVSASRRTDWQAVKFMQAFTRLRTADASLMEINPFLLTTDIG